MWGLTKYKGKQFRLFQGLVSFMICVQSGRWFPISGKLQYSLYGVNNGVISSLHSLGKLFYI